MKPPSPHTKKKEQLEENLIMAVLYLAECIEEGTWQGVYENTKLIMLRTPQKVSRKRR